MSIDLNQEISLKSFSNFNYQIIINFVVVISVIALLVSGGLLINTLTQIRRQPDNVTASQLLNQKAIDQALDLLQNQTVNFQLE